MPDSPSIPATGWDGLPKRKPQALLVQVAKDRHGLRPAATPLTGYSRTPRTRYPKKRLALIGILITAFVALLCLFAISARSSDHLRRQASQSSSIWDNLLFQEEDVDTEIEATLPEPDIVPYPQQRQHGSGPLSHKLEHSLAELCSSSQANTSITAKYNSKRGFLRRSLLYAGSGNDLRKVLQRARMLSETWLSSQASQGGDAAKAFRVMVIGGSVSNCRGVDRGQCWHSHLMRWLSKTFPLGDPQDKTQVSYRFIDLAKSATGSTFFSYCWQSELVLRKKQTPYLWGEGPDLIIVETGINDVVSPNDFVDTATGQSYARDFESLLWQLKSLPSRPAVVVLDAASKLLEKLQGFNQAAEFTTHLAASVWMDVPVISAKSALMTAAASEELSEAEDLYLADAHHPNARGHEVLADLLVAHLESVACQTADMPETAPSHHTLPQRSFSAPLTDSPKSLSPSTEQCIQVGVGGERRKPRRNRGWSRLATSRDKQYMASSSIGSRIVYDVIVGEGGQVLLSWLKSRFYNLGDAKVLLDNQKPGVRISGHWDLGWSIGVPTVLFENVSPGPHTVTIEHVKPVKALYSGTNFRLIAVATT
ncbi:hypothetical protein P389DRAFT_196942 [Cystobasidium minutum MCA 4210]|uniref:uncharacterized protein n=1 Tax=Cystobasidium minutum MCA 4210 TaxID=1397322 RepID=UPI0034CD298E|eukprot:jgi/Rhomi1/196942/gm1.5156_g